MAHNATILNAIYIKMYESGVSEKVIERFARISPIAWTLISFTGKHNFKKINGQIDFEEIVAMLEAQLRVYKQNRIGLISIIARVYVECSSSDCAFLRVLQRDPKNKRI